MHIVMNGAGNSGGPLLDSQVSHLLLLHLGMEIHAFLANNLVALTPVPCRICSCHVFQQWLSAALGQQNQIE